MNIFATIYHAVKHKGTKLHDAIICTLLHHDDYRIYTPDSVVIRCGVCARDKLIEDLKE